MSLRLLTNSALTKILTSNQGQTFLITLAYLLFYTYITSAYRLLFGTYYFLVGLCDGYFFGYPTDHEQRLHCARYYHINNARAWKDIFDEEYWEWRTCVGHAWGRDMGFDLLGILRGFRRIELHIVSDDAEQMGDTGVDIG
jgi:hypothetical protein